MGESIGTTLAALTGSMGEKALGEMLGVYFLLGIAFFLGWWYWSLAKRRPDAIERFCPWGILDVLFAAATFLAVQVVCAVVLHPWIPVGEEAPAWVMSVAIIASGLAALTVVFVLLRMRYGFWPRDIGLDFSRWPRALLLAVVLLALVLALRVPMAAVFEYLHVRAGEEIVRQHVIERMLADKSWAAMALMVVAAVVVAPVWEEIAFRGFLQPFLGRWMGPRTALVVTAVLFALIHEERDVRFFMAPILIFPLALALGYARQRTGRLAAPILLHVLHNSLTVAVVIALR